MGKSKSWYFAVGTADALHSSAWRAWIQGDDFYLAQMTLHPTVVTKLSVHQSGVVRFATHKPQDAPPLMDIAWNADPDPRVAKRWHIDPVSAQRLCWCVYVIVPHIEVRDRFRLVDVVGRERASRTLLVEQDELDRACIVAFLRTPTRDASLDRALRPGDRVLGHLDLRSGARMWAIRRTQRVLPADLARWRHHRDSARMATARPSPGRFGSLLMLEGDEVPAIFELALGKQNFVEDDGRGGEGRLRVDSPLWPGPFNP